MSLELEMLLGRQTVRLDCRDSPHLRKPGLEVLQTGGRVVELLLRVDQVLMQELLRSTNQAQPYHHCKSLNLWPDLEIDSHNRGEKRNIFIPLSA